MFLVNIHKMLALQYLIAAGMWWVTKTLNSVAEICFVLLMWFNSLIIETDSNRNLRCFSNMIITCCYHHIPAGFDAIFIFRIWTYSIIINDGTHRCQLIKGICDYPEHERNANMHVKALCLFIFLTFCHPAVFLTNSSSLGNICTGRFRAETYFLAHYILHIF